MEVEDRRKNVKNTPYSQMIAADKAKGKKKIQELRTKRLVRKKKELVNAKKDTKLTPAIKKALQIHGYSANQLKLLGLDSTKGSAYRAIVENKAKNVKKADATKEKKYKDKIQTIANVKKNIKKAAMDVDKNVTKSKAGKDEPWMKYSSISAAKKAGSLYYNKRQGGKDNKMAAVTQDMMKAAGYTSFGAKSLTKYMNEQLRKKKKQ